MPNRPVIIFGGDPVFSIDVPEAVFRFGLDDATLKISRWHQIKDIDQRLADYSLGTNNVTFVDKSIAFECSPNCRLANRNGDLLFVNYAHLTISGIEHLARYIEGLRLFPNIQAQLSDNGNVGLN